jgi:hypothetical protein
MVGVDQIGEIRRAYFEQRRPIKEIVRTLAVSRATVRRVIRSQKTAFKYERGVQPVPKLGDWVGVLCEILDKEAKLLRRERRSTQRLYEELRGRGYEGAHDSVHRFVRAWREERARVPVQAFVPMSFAPGEAYQFDWSHETITLQGLPLLIKAAHMKLSHSRMPFVRVYFRETQEMVFDAHAVPVRGSLRHCQSLLSSEKAGLLLDYKSHRRLRTGPRARPHPRRRARDQHDLMFAHSASPHTTHTPRTMAVRHRMTMTRPITAMAGIGWGCGGGGGGIGSIVPIQSAMDSSLRFELAFRYRNRRSSARRYRRSRRLSRSLSRRPVTRLWRTWAPAIAHRLVLWRIGNRRRYPDIRGAVGSDGQNSTVDTLIGVVND